ncbi:TMV resistance protein N [Glycine soja]|uniref:TMV resistance protein N n=1 Tax=Glycine soja TaxID=3848 RepID=A0A0B2PNV7_GLYSO|nr:TMV resistance protein N [Glycine soja]
MAVRSSSYDVFLSFRGEDTRHGFTGNLYNVLRERGIDTFIDDEELQKGHEITKALEEAIEKSKIFIIVLSENYASSSFCLNELTHILNFTKGKSDRSILPVFYKVDPSDVRYHRGSFGEALANHEKNLNSNYMEKLQIWKMALQQVSNFSGHHFQPDGDKYEYDFIKEIVESVPSKFNRNLLYVSDVLVGLKSPVLAVKSLLDVGADDVVHMVGIHGLGGVGKTTLAVAVYNSIACHFEACCFLENVRETSNKKGLESLQNILLSKTVGDMKIEVTNSREGTDIIKRKLKEKKVLLVLDDVNEHEQLQAIIDSPDWFGRGSRVIITTRDEQLLVLHNVKRTYKVRELNEKHALQLLTQKAFGLEKKVDPSYHDILNRAVTYASGLPLALKVIGSNLFGKSIEEWESVLDGYERSPDKSIYMTLKVSYDALNEDEKSIFLDIACCFKDYELAKVQDILYAHYGTGKIEIICMNFSSFGKEVEWDGDALKKMENLKTLIIKSACFSKGPKHLPNSLRVLEWWRCPSQDLPHNFNPKQLAICKLPHSNFTSLGLAPLFDKASSVVNLTSLILDECDSLTEIPDVSCLSKLEKLSFKDCRNLFTIHPSVGLLEKLKILDAKGCRKLESFPPLKLTSLEWLKLSYCVNLESIPECIEECRFLTTLIVDGCARLQEIRGIPPNLKKFSATGCPALTSSSISMFLNQELHEARDIYVNLPRVKIPKWFECQSRGESIVFWFRNKFPAIIVCIDTEFCFDELAVNVFINDEDESNHVSLDVTECCMGPSTAVFRLKMEDYLDEELLKNEWNRAEIGCEYLWDEYAIHVLKEQSSMEDIRFTKKRLRVWKKQRRRCPSQDSSFTSVGLDPFYEKASRKNGKYNKILGKMENITELDLSECPITKLPPSFRNLTRLQELELDHGPESADQLMDFDAATLISNICMMPELYDISARRLQWRLLPDDALKLTSVVCSSVHSLTLELSDELLPLFLSWFVNVENLRLEGSKCTVIPECIKECRFLSILILSGCDRLQEIRGIPPNLERFAATESPDLTSSSISMLLNQELHEAGHTDFSLPILKIPEWFECQSRGPSIFFWFRNEFPAITFCIVKSHFEAYSSDSLVLSVIINKKHEHKHDRFHDGCFSKTPSTSIFRLQMKDNLDEEISKSEWNHAEIVCNLSWDECGIHVLKEQSSMEDIRFTDPFRKRKNCCSEEVAVGGKKQRLVGSEVVETKFVEQQQHMGFLSHVWNWTLSLVMSRRSGNQ